MNFPPLSLSFLLLAGTVGFWPLLAHSQNRGAGAAVASEAATTQPRAPGRLSVPAPERKTPPPSVSPRRVETIDPLLDPARPRNSQLTLETEQTVRCGETEVVLPTGVYKQILLMENPEGRRATDTTDLSRQQPGLGYIRYLSDENLRVGGELRSGGVDVGIRAEDNLPVRIWYKKMTQPDGVTKAFTFILPPLGLLAGAGAWSSGNLLIPDEPFAYTEARDYYLKPPKPVADAEEIPKPAHVRPIIRPQDSGPMRVRSK